MTAIARDTDSCVLRRVVAALALSLVALAASVAVASNGATVVDAGRSDYRIEVAESAGGVRGAADELAAYIDKATGARLPVVKASADDAPTIRIAVDPGAGLGTEGFRIATAGEDVRITGGGPAGARYGVYAFLERYAGVRWFAPEFTRVPERATLTVTGTPVEQRPAFAYREVFVREADDRDYSAHNRLNGRFGQRLTGYTDSPAFTPLRKRHVFRLVPPKRYRDSHPEYFGGGQLRFAEPGVQAAAIAAVRELLAKWGDGDYALLIEHADVDSYYRGAPDKALIERYGTPAGAYLTFVRAIAEAVAEDYPRVTILAQAYRWSRQPPQGMRLPANMGVMFSDIERDFARPLAQPANRAILEDLRGWQRATDTVWLWSYITNFAGYLQPFPDLRTLGPDLRELAQLPAVSGVFAQGAYNTLGSEFARLRAWLLARLLWDPSQDVDALIDEFLAGYYGDAAPQIGRYIELLHESIAATDTPLRDKMAPAAGYLTPELLRRADRLFAEAESRVAGQPPYLRHVRTARMPVDYAILAGPALAGESGHDARLERLTASMEHAGVSAYREGRGNPPAQLIEALAIERKAAPRPRPCREAGQPDCPVAQELGFDLAGGARLVADPAASDGAAARLSGDRAAWGIQIPLERLLPRTGTWRIYASVRVPGSGGGDADRALKAGVYPGRQTGVSQGAVDGADYRLVELPGSWQGDGGRYVWFAPAKGGRVEALLVDRVFAVRETGGA